MKNRLSSPNVISPQQVVCQLMDWTEGQAAQSLIASTCETAPIYETFAGFVCVTEAGQLPPTYQNLTWRASTGKTARKLAQENLVLFVSTDTLPEVTDPSESTHTLTIPEGNIVHALCHST